MVADLSNGLGNLLNRCTTTKLNPHQVFPVFKKEVFLKIAFQEDKQMIAQLEILPGRFLLTEFLLNFHLKWYCFFDQLINGPG